VYVVDQDYYHAHIQKFDGNGKFLTKWGSLGSGDGQFKHPTALLLVQMDLYT